MKLYILYSLEVLFQLWLNVKFGKNIPSSESGVEFIEDKGLFGTEFTIDGIKTNIKYQYKILENPYFEKGDITTSFILDKMNND